MNLDLMGFILEIILPNKLKDGAYLINLDEYFDSFETEHILKEIKNFTNNINIIANIYRVQNYVRIYLYWIYRLYVYG